MLRTLKSFCFRVLSTNPYHIRNENYDILKKHSFKKDSRKFIIGENKYFYEKSPFQNKENTEEEILFYILKIL